MHMYCDAELPPMYEENSTTIAAKTKNSSPDVLGVPPSAIYIVSRNQTFNASHKSIPLRFSHHKPYHRAKQDVISEVSTIASAVVPLGVNVSAYELEKAPAAQPM